MARRRRGAPSAAAGGRWLNHDGVVVATFHRETAGGFESFVGYMPNGRLLRKYRKVNE